VRLDKWLWAARFVKTRALAAEAIGGGKVDLNGERPKRAHTVRSGDEIRIRLGPYEHRVIVRAVSAHRGSAQVAAQLYEETAESREARAKVAALLKTMPSYLRGESGRPSKKDRRSINRVRGRE
jgi:ribosome-associated heat shock protein Hsp15